MVHSKDMSFLFSQGFLRGIILELGFLPYPKLCLHFQRTKGNCSCVFTFRLHGNSLCVSPGDEWTATNLFSVVRKFFGGLFLGTNHGRRFRLSADTHMANREWGPPTPTSSFNDREGGRRDGFSFHYPAYCCRPLNSCSLPCSVTGFLPPQLCKCFRVSYFLVTIFSLSLSLSLSLSHTHTHVCTLAQLASAAEYTEWNGSNRTVLTFKLYSSSSSSRHAINTNIPDPLLPPLLLVHCFQQVFRVTSCIGKELLDVGSSWSSCLCSSMWSGPQEYIPYELVPTSPAVSHMPGSSNFDCFRDGW